MTMEDRIYKKLQGALQPESLKVVNQSHLHAGHAGDDGSGESHFKIEIGSETLNAMGYVAREREVHKILAEEIPLIHALGLKFIK